MDKKAENLSEIIGFVKEQFKLITDEEEIHNLWFRAEKLFIPFAGESVLQSDVLNAIPYTPLLPSAYRKYGRVNEFTKKQKYVQTKEIEGNLKAEFLRNSTMFLNKNRIENNQWNNYFLMQHYGLSTRLLDWTESALVAIYFAVRDENTEDCRIWILNPHRLNNSTVRYFKNINTTFICFPQDSKKTGVI